jgi:hypothetical protein
MDDDQNSSISLVEFTRVIMEDSSPKSKLYQDFNNVLVPYVDVGTIGYDHLVQLLKQLTSKTSKSATIVKNSKDSLVETIKDFPNLIEGQKIYLDSLNDMTLEEVENEMDFLTVAGSYCSHLIDRFYYLMTDNEDCIIRDYLKVKTNEFEEESKKKRVRGV